MPIHILLQQIRGINMKTELRCLTLSQIVKKNKMVVYYVCFNYVWTQEFCIVIKALEMRWNRFSWILLCA